MIIQNNAYQGAKFFNSSNRVVANIITFSNSLSDFFSLRETNRILAEENALLRDRIIKGDLDFTIYNGDGLAQDSVRYYQYEFIAAKVVNNSTRMFKNHFTINKGSNDGIMPGMAVISSQGVAGKVKTVSPRFAVVTSLLHTDVMISSRIQRTGHAGTTQWDAADPTHAELKFIPRHVKLQLGDTIVTSGYNAIFPEGILIGTIEQIDITDEAVFYNIRMKLSQDFDKLGFVYVVKNNLKDELELLETESIDNK